MKGTQRKALGKRFPKGADVLASSDDWTAMNSPLAKRSSLQAKISAGDYF
jgi:hypothetical protein